MKSKLIYIVLLNLLLIDQAIGQSVIQIPPNTPIATIPTPPTASMDLGIISNEGKKDWPITSISANTPGINVHFELSASANVSANIGNRSGAIRYIVDTNTQRQYTNTGSSLKNIDINLPKGKYYFYISGIASQSGLSFFGIQTAITFETAASIPINNTITLPKDKNYIITTTPLFETKSVSIDQGVLLIDGALNTNTSKNTQITISYFDGLGRPTQTIQRGITPDGKDLVAIQEYDAFGRESNSWLPGKVTTANNGAFVAIETAKGYIKTSNGSDAAPYSRPVYEASPLNRVLEQYGPGSDWQTATNGKSVKTGYLTNKDKTGVINTVGDSLVCALYVSSSNSQIVSISKSINYAANQLYVTRMIDEDSNRSYEFKDKLGQVVLTRQINNNQLHDTYYIYDDFGNLRVVLPPIASDKLSASGTWTDTNTDLQQYAYLYKYDGRNRPTYKKLPGCEPILYVYDKADRLIFTQDGEQRGKTPQEWTYAIPDAFGRTVLSGVCKTVNDSAITVGRFDKNVIKAQFATTGTYKAYNLTVGTKSLNLGVQTVLSVNYYDNYDFMGFNGIPKITDNDFKPETITGYGVQHTSSKGFLTGSMAALLDGSTTMLYSVMYYDNRGRLIQTKSNNHLAAGIEKEYIAYNFTGQLTKRMHIHSATGKTTQTEVYTYAYDHAGRLLTTKHKLNTGAEVILAENTYDDLGRLKTNKKASNANLQTTYAYNIRSWTKSITSNLFKETLYYNDSYQSSVKRYNGNIGAMDWNVWDQAKNTWEKERAYSFEYDNLSQLKAANYFENKTANSNYTVSSITYDKHGNLLTLTRRGKINAAGYGDIDNFTNMIYNGNQLISLKENAGNVSLAESGDFKDYSGGVAGYTYNKNGAMETDKYAGISNIQYNSLNLPQELLVKNTNNVGKVYYTYSASGVKLRAKHLRASNMGVIPIKGSGGDASYDGYATMDYVGNIVYEDRKGQSPITRILIDGGYVENNVYYFYLTDHLGNNRVVAKTDGTIIQKNHYYPFGMAFTENTKEEQTRQPYKFGNKELDQELGINVYDFEARQLTNGVPRFTSVDPLAEKYYSISPYVYCLNNPLKYIDPKGDSVRVYTETVDGGHAWLSVGEGDDMVIYSYGPFSEGGRSGSEGGKVLTGQGIVVKYTGADARKYLNDKKETADMMSSVISDVSDDQVANIVEPMLSKGYVQDKSETYSSGEQEGVITGTTEYNYVGLTYGMYNVATNNCTTFVSDVLNASGSKSLNATRTITNRSIGEVNTVRTKQVFVVPSHLRNHLNKKK